MKEITRAQIPNLISPRWWIRKGQSRNVSMMFTPNGAQLLRALIHKLGRDGFDMLLDFNGFNSLVLRFDDCLSRSLIYRLHWDFCSAGYEDKV